MLAGREDGARRCKERCKDIARVKRRRRED